MDRILLDAMHYHKQRTGHGEYTIGLNFIDCHECRRHAHRDYNPARAPLVTHDADCSEASWSDIWPDAF